jgi:hypothetical protein
VKQLAKRARANAERFGPEPAPEETARNVAAIDRMQVGDMMINGVIVRKAR